MGLFWLEGLVFFGFVGIWDFFWFSFLVGGGIVFCWIGVLVWGGVKMGMSLVVFCGCLFM